LACRFSTLNIQSGRTVDVGRWQQVYFISDEVNKRTICCSISGFGLRPFSVADCDREFELGPAYACAQGLTFLESRFLIHRRSHGIILSYNNDDHLSHIGLVCLRLAANDYGGSCTPRIRNQLQSSPSPRVLSYRKTLSCIALIWQLPKLQY
jgi:hypothetical protein